MATRLNNDRANMSIIATQIDFIMLNRRLGGGKHTKDGFGDMNIQSIAHITSSKLCDTI